jgi:two-component system, OmpR family, KDP operon response regulator KdpE
MVVRSERWYYERAPTTLDAARRVGDGMDQHCDVLIVEDDPVICALLVEILTDEGYSVQTVLDGANAVSAIETTRPSLILLDLGLSDLDGIETLGRLRVCGQYSGPIIAMSTRPERPESLLDAGATAVLPKPFSLGELLSVVRHYVNSPQ